ncbi:hypothetical protein GGR57DRAFT_227919 [Xylariaceae sp. FL1272]|nr:hypothetical protein GGR57DRAFT_227919 [Xylariaceae sp. FL1272]
MMPDPNKAQIILASFSRLKDRYHVTSETLETSYGLVLGISAQGIVYAKLKDGAPQASNTVYSQKTKESGFKYRLFPEYGAGFLWYESSWPGNPEKETMVDDDDLEARYGKPWYGDAYQPWVDRWQDSFKTNCNDKGDFQAHPFSNAEEEKAWVLEGMLLAVWLSLQPYVASVEYTPHATTNVFRSGHLEKDIRSFFDGLDDNIECLNSSSRDNETPQSPDKDKHQDED